MAVISTPNTTLCTRSCPIDLKDGVCPCFGPIYGLSEPELKALKIYIEENLAKGFIYLDDILIFSQDYIDHTKHVRLILSKLQEHGFYEKPEKCEFDLTSVEFLGYVI